MTDIQLQIEKYRTKFGANSSCYSMMDDLEEVKALFGHNSMDVFLHRCVCNRKRHQRRIKSMAVSEAVVKLKREVRSLQECSYFDELYDLVYLLIGKGRTGISYCTVYDTCIRMGYCFSPAILPQEYVYVHRHLIKEANSILGYGHIKDRCRIRRNLFDETDKGFIQMSSLEIEDFLCVKQQLIKEQIKRKQV